MPFDCHDTPHPPSAPSPLEEARGEKALDSRVRRKKVRSCPRDISNRGRRKKVGSCQHHLRSSAFSPTLFVGEKVAKPDEGAFDSREDVADLEHFAKVIHVVR